MDENVLVDDADIQIVDLCRRPGVVVPKGDRPGNAVDALEHEITWRQEKCGERESGHRWAFLALPKMGTRHPTRDIWIVLSTSASPPANQLVCLDCNLVKTVAIHKTCPRCLAEMGPTISGGSFAVVAASISAEYSILPESYVAQRARCPTCGYIIFWCGYEQ